MNIFYINPVDVTECTLNAEESWHCAKVLRLQKGEIINMIDGQGGFYTGRLIDTSPQACQVYIESIIEQYNKRNYYLHIAMAPTKSSDRFEWFLEKATEIGIDEITPLQCMHSERKNINIDRCKKILLSATKQSVNAFLPKVNPLIKFDKFIKEKDFAAKYIAHCNDTPRDLLSSKYEKGSRTIILIGPEGDFDLEEVKASQAQGFQAISLGQSRLRTETAGVVAAHTVSLMNEMK